MSENVNRFQTAAARLEARRREFASESVQFIRASDGAAADDDVPAAVGSTPFELQDESGVVVIDEHRDFLVQKDDLVIQGVPYTPQRGDRITQIIDGDEVTFELMAPRGEPVARTSGNIGQTWRIHTKRVAPPAITS